MQDKSNLRKIYEAIRGGVGSSMSAPFGPAQEYMRDILKPEGFDFDSEPVLSIRELFEMEFKRARERGDEVFEFMGKPYHTKTKEEVEAAVPGYAAGTFINLPNSLPAGTRGIEDILAGNMTPPTYDVTDPNFKFEPDLSVDFGKYGEGYDFDKSAYENYMKATRTVEDDARDDLAKGVEKEKLKLKAEKFKNFGELLSQVGEANAFKYLIEAASGAGMLDLIKKPPKINIPEIQRYNGGGLANLDLDFDFDINDYLENVLGVDVGEVTEEGMATALARAYGAPSEGIGSYSRSMGYRDTTPGAPISINAKDTTPDVYRFYPSEVSKIYSQAKGVPFSPLVAPPREATYIDALQPRRMASQLYAKDGKYVNAYADGTGSMGAIREMASGAKRGISSLAEGITSIPSAVYNYLNPSNENVEDVKVTGIPKYPYGHPSEAVENLHDRRRDINDIIEEGYYIDREQRDVIYLDDNPKAFNALLNELKLIDKELQMTQGMGGNTRRMNEANQTMANVIKNLRGYADGTGAMGVENYPERDELVTGPGGEQGDQIPAMLSDGEFVTNSAAVRGMGIAAGANPQDEYEQRLLGAREMYKMQKFGEEIAQQLV